MKEPASLRLSMQSKLALRSERGWNRRTAATGSPSEMHFGLAEAAMIEEKAPAETSGSESKVTRSGHDCSGQLSNSRRRAEKRSAFRHLALSECQTISVVGFPPAECASLFRPTS